MGSDISLDKIACLLRTKSTCTHVRKNHKYVIFLCTHFVDNYGCSDRQLYNFFFSI